MPSLRAGLQPGLCLVEKRFLPLIRTHFRKPFEGEAGIFVTAADILEQISSCLRYPLSPNKIGRIMAGLEFESIRYKGKRGYITVKKTGEDIDRERRSGALGL